MTFAWKLESRLDEVARVRQLLEEALRASGFSQELVHDLSLIAEEMLVNTISYGSPRKVEVTLDIESETVFLQFKDDGLHFNPLEAEDRDPDDERLGGWGIPMLKALSDEVSYLREGEHNVLKVSRRERDS